MTGPSWPGTKTRVLRRRIASWAARGETRGPAAGVRSRGRKCNNELISVMAGDPGHGPAWPGVNWQGDIMSTLRPRHPDWWGTMNIVTLMRVCHSYGRGWQRRDDIYWRCGKSFSQKTCWLISRQGPFIQLSKWFLAWRIRQSKYI